MVIFNIRAMRTAMRRRDSADDAEGDAIIKTRILTGTYSAGLLNVDGSLLKSGAGVSLISVKVDEANTGLISVSRGRLDFSQDVTGTVAIYTRGALRASAAPPAYVVSPGHRRVTHLQRGHERARHAPARGWRSHPR